MNATSHLPSVSRRPAVARPASFRPTLEALDDRVVLSAVGGLGSAGALLAPAPVQYAEVTQKGRESAAPGTEIVVTKPSDSATALIRLRRIVTDATTMHDAATTVHPAVATMSFQWGVGRADETTHMTAMPAESLSFNF
jgi:hypothetical protein